MRPNDKKPQNTHARRFVNVRTSNPERLDRHSGTGRLSAPRKEQAAGRAWWLDEEADREHDNSTYAPPKTQVLDLWSSDCLREAREELEGEWLLNAFRDVQDTWNKLSNDVLYVDHKSGVSHSSLNSEDYLTDMCGLQIHYSDSGSPRFNGNPIFDTDFGDLSKFWSSSSEEEDAIDLDEFPPLPITDTVLRKEYLKKRATIEALVKCHKELQGAKTKTAKAALLQKLLLEHHTQHEGSPQRHKDHPSAKSERCSASTHNRKSVTRNGRGPSNCQRAMAAH